MLKKLLSLGRRARAEPNAGGRVAPTGCFTVYVGPERKRFVIKTEYANHPLFKMLLEDAELEYGFCNDGPLLLPCHVDLFYTVLAEIDAANNDGGVVGYGGACSPFNPARRLGRSVTGVGKGCGGYGRLTPPRLVRFDHF